MKSRFNFTATSWRFLFMWITSCLLIAMCEAQNWPQFGFTPAGGRYNSNETVLGTSNVGSLQVLWTFGNGNQSNSSPAVVDGAVYVGSFDGNTYALNARTGAKLWQFATGVSGNSSPAVANGVVYVGSWDHNLYALNASTGARLWQFTTGGHVESSPAVAGGVVYVGSDDGNLYALNASTGAKLWQFATGSQVASSPAVADGVVYGGSGNLYALNASTGAELWQFAAGGIIGSAPAMADGVVYVGSGTRGAIALNASTGAELWQFAAGSLASAPAVANGVVYVGSMNSTVYALNAGTGAKLWQFTTGGAVYSSPAVANGIVYIGSDDGSLYALNANTGAKLGQFTTGGGNAVASSPAVANGVVYVGSVLDTVFAFGQPPGPTVTITANPISINVGQTTKLTWSSTNATSCATSDAWSGSSPAVNGGAHEPTSGSLTVTPIFITSPNQVPAVDAYALTCTGLGGSANATAYVLALAPTITITANPTSIGEGQTASLTWSSTNATSCFATDAWSGASPAIPAGTPLGLFSRSPLILKPPMTTTPKPIQTFDSYPLTCTGPGGSVIETATVAVNPPYVKSFCGGWWGGGPCLCEQCVLGSIEGGGARLNVGPFQPFGQIEPGTVGPVLVLQSGTIEDISVEPVSGRKLRGGEDEITTITISPGSKVVTSGELGGNVRIVTATVDSSKLRSRLPVERCPGLSAALLAAEHPGAKPKIVGVAFLKGKVTGLLVNSDVLPLAAPPTKK